MRLFIMGVIGGDESRKSTRAQGLALAIIALQQPSRLRLRPSSSYSRAHITQLAYIRRAKGLAVSESRARCKLNSRRPLEQADGPHTSTHTTPTRSTLLKGSMTPAPQTLLQQWKCVHDC